MTLADYALPPQQMNSQAHHLRGGLDTKLLIELGCLDTLILEATDKPAIQGGLNGGSSH